MANANKLIHHYVAETATSTSCSTFVFDPLGNSIENASIEMGDDDDSMLRCGVRFDENILLNDNKVVITIIKVPQLTIFFYHLLILLTEPGIKPGTLASYIPVHLHC